MMDKRYIKKSIVSFLYKKFFGETLEDESKNISESKKFKGEFENEKKGLSEFFQSVSGLQHQDLPPEDVDEWRKELFEETQSIVKVQKLKKRKETTKQFLRKIKNFWLSPRISPVPVLIACFVFFLAGVFANRLGGLLESDKNKANIFLPGTKVQQIQFIEKPSLSSDEVSFVLQTITPYRVEGKISDEFVKKVIVSSLLLPSRPATKLECISIIKKHSHLVFEKQIQQALHHILLNDLNSEVRLQSMNLLVKNSFTSQTQQSLLKVIETDNSSFIRAAAAKLFASKVGEYGIKLDRYVEMRLSKQMNSESNRYVKEQITLAILNN